MNLEVWLAEGGCGWNISVWLVGMVVRRYTDFLTFTYSCICSFLHHLLFVHFVKGFLFLSMPFLIATTRVITLCHSHKFHVLIPTECSIPGQVFMECGSACPAVCGKDQPMICTLQCVVGCQCPSGALLDKVAGRCVETVDKCTGTDGEAVEPDLERVL